MTYADEAFKWVDTGYISVSFLSYINPVMALVHQFSYVIQGSNSTTIVLSMEDRTSSERLVLELKNRSSFSTNRILHGSESEFSISIIITNHYYRANYYCILQSALMLFFFA